jgi:hypothetical protein
MSQGSGGTIVRLRFLDQGWFAVGIQHSSFRRAAGWCGGAALIVTMIVVGASVVSAQDAPAPSPAAVDAEPVASTPSPTAAAVRSLVLPGWGQAWVGSPGRGSVLFAMEAGSVWMLFRTQNRLNEARELEQFLRETGQHTGDERHPLVAARERQRESWITMAVFLLFFSAADAYVAAQLADFDERVAIHPGPDGGVTVGASIPLGRRR